MIHVIATIEVHAGRREDLLAEFRSIVPQVLAEDGCLEYGPAVDAPTDIAAQLPVREHAVTVVEKWASLEHLKHHLTAPHMQEFREKVREIVARTTLVILRPAGAGIDPGSPPGRG
jgi:quinol monooxygenase YgiN